MSTLNVPICINGDNKDPSTLEERELFVNTQTKYLFSGFPNSNVDKIKVGFSDETSKIFKSWLNIDTSFDTPVFKVGDMEYNGSQFTSTSTYIMDRMSITNLNKLVLINNNTLYGRELPKKEGKDYGVEGQVFFKLG